MVVVFGRAQHGVAAMGHGHTRLRFSLYGLAIASKVPRSKVCVAVGKGEGGTPCFLFVSYGILTVLDIPTEQESRIVTWARL